MKRDPKSGLWLPNKLRDERGIVGFLPVIGGNGGGGLTPPLTGLLQWYKTPQAYADNEQITNGAAKWLDASGNNFHLDCSNAGATGPIYHSSGGLTLNGVPSIEFIPAEVNTFTEDFTGVSAFLDLTEATVYMVLQCRDDPGPAGGQVNYFATMDPNEGLSNFPGAWPFSDSHIYSAIFTTVQKDLGDPADSVTVPFYVGIFSQANDYVVRLNGAEIFSTGTNTFPNLNTGTKAFNVGRANSNFIEQNANMEALFEILVWDHYLDAGEMAEAEAYIVDRYGF